MNPDERDPKRTWLNQHDSLQEELQKLKEEMKADIREEPISDPEPEIARTGKQQPAEEEDPDQEDGMEDPPKTSELSIKDMLGSVEIREAPVTGDGPKLQKPEGAIPKHPELTSYIAKVMQHESRLKRKKFEREKVTNPREEASRRSEAPAVKDPPIDEEVNLIEDPQPGPGPVVDPAPERIPEQEPLTSVDAPPEERTADNDPPILQGNGPVPEQSEAVMEEGSYKEGKYMTDVSDPKPKDQPPAGKGFLVRIRRFLGRR
ncbi:MAG: hypothetical protein QCI82_08990 [Candidatus Thermoplasmatota archaeon]|nr:hypothetical protein [Candidatus Thermoplasmatota archaeon]